MKSKKPPARKGLGRMPQSKAELHDRALDGYRRGFEKASGNAKAANLLLAIVYCGGSGVPIPQWAVQPFREATLAWWFLRCDFEAAFGVTRVKHRASKLLRQWAMSPLMDELDRRRQEGLPRDWKAIGQKLGCSHTMLEKLYRESDILRELFPSKSKNRGSRIP